ncbi:hypothetical protein [Phyllobacterium endophyticum]|uniref:hypothetical protein n=1 Tax=Phyllobacterium endophyticum TaxID=1149773 RepID=UPI0011CCBB7F|nr:hypothetical protein [Phyllobacterium endophyticum]TXR49878.1 hypothetical protein FVA77_07645 [Phyllobacterium endophyticum]
MSEHLSHIEKRIIKLVIEGALRRGWTIAVYDGEEWVLKPSSDAAAILKETAATDETVYSFRDEDGKTLGRMYFVHGNDEDVISDMTDNEHMRALDSYATGYLHL